MSLKKSDVFFLWLYSQIFISSSALSPIHTPPLTAVGSIVKLCHNRFSSGPLLIGQRVTQPAEHLTLPVRYTCNRLRMRLFKIALARTRLLFFSVFSFVFVTPVGAKKSFCKNTYKHVEKARKGPEKARNVQRVRFIWASSSLHTHLWWASLHNPDGWCAVPPRPSSTQVSKILVLLFYAGDFYETIMWAVIARKSLGMQSLPPQPRSAAH